MTTSNFNYDDLAAIRAAIASGARRVRIQGEETEFRSLEEMERIEAKIMNDVSGGNGRVRRTVVVQTRA